MGTSWLALSPWMLERAATAIGGMRYWMRGRPRRGQVWKTTPEFYIEKKNRSTKIRRPVSQS